MEHFFQDQSIVPLLHCSKVNALCAFTLARPAHVLAILPQLYHPLDNGQAILEALALGQPPIMGPTLLEQGAGLFRHRVVGLLKLKDYLAVDLLQIGYGEDEGVRVIVEALPVEAIPEVRADEISRDAGKLHEPSGRPLADETPRACVRHHDGEVGLRQQGAARKDPAD